MNSEKWAYLYLYCILQHSYVYGEKIVCKMKHSVCVHVVYILLVRCNCLLNNWFKSSDKKTILSLMNSVLFRIDSAWRYLLSSLYNGSWSGAHGQRDVYALIWQAVSNFLPSSRVFSSIAHSQIKNLKSYMVNLQDNSNIWYTKFPEISYVAFTYMYYIYKCYAFHPLLIDALFKFRFIWTALACSSYLHLSLV